MTCLIAWIGVDDRGPTSCYLAADSRFSWNPTGNVWDHGRKVFCSRKSPDIWGYYGDVMFPSNVLGQIVEAIDEGLLTEEEDSQALFERAFKEQFDTYPMGQANEFGVLHCRREGTSIGSSFSITQIGWRPRSGWISKSLELPTKSGIVGSFGSGKACFDSWSHQFTKSDVGGTSRAVFQAFCKMLEEGEDRFVGGAPQLVSLVRVGNGQQQGIVWNGEAWLAGLRLKKGDFRPTIEFRDALFQRCDPTRLGLLEGAQKQPLPTQVTKGQ